MSKEESGFIIDVEFDFHFDFDVDFDFDFDFDLDLNAWGWGATSSCAALTPDISSRAVSALEQPICHPDRRPHERDMTL